MTDDGSILWRIIFQLVLIAVSGVFSCTEIAIISCNDNKLERMANGDARLADTKRAKRLVWLTGQPARFLATIQVGITLAGFLGSAFAADGFSAPLARILQFEGSPLSADAAHTAALVLITLVLSYFTLVLGELVPKRLAMQQAEEIALSLSGLIYCVAKLFSPVVWLLTASTNGFLRLCGVDPDAEPEEATEEEIRMMVDVGRIKGNIDDDEQEIIHNVFEFDNKTADEVMTHRTESVVLWLEEDGSQWDEAIAGTMHSYYPICDDSADNIVGILSAKKYFRLADKSRENVMANAVSAPQFVPESVKTDVLFRNMKRDRNHFAVVLDDKGGVSGIVTINDLLEQLVGDLPDDTAEPDLPEIEVYETDSDGGAVSWKISGAADLAEVSKLLGVSLPEDEYDTLAEYVLAVFGTIPGDGETPEILLPEQGLVVRVTSMREHRLEYAVVRKVESDKNDTAETAEAEKTEATETTAVAEITEIIDTANGM